MTESDAATEECGLCERESDFELLVMNDVRLVAPGGVHVEAADGGHLIAVPLRHAQTRWDLSLSEVAGIHVLSYVGAIILQEAFRAGWWNVQENGNWGLGTPSGPHMHAHIYGRTLDSVVHPYGEAVRLPKRGAPLPSYGASELEHLAALARRIVPDWLDRARAKFLLGHDSWREGLVLVFG